MNSVCIVLVRVHRLIFLLQQVKEENEAMFERNNSKGDGGVASHIVTLHRPEQSVSTVAMQLTEL